MKRFILAAVFLLCATSARAQTATITGTLLNVDSTVCANCTIFFNSQVTQVISGVTYQPQMKSTSTNASGVISSITLPQGLAVQISVSENGQTFPPYTAIVPFLPAVTFDTLNQGVLLDPLNILASLYPPTGPLSMNSQKITNLACPSNANDALAWGCNASVANLTVTGTFNQTTSGSAFFGLFTNTAIANPSAPVGTAIGTTGATQYYYFLVCHDANGGATIASTPGASVANANATLSVTNYVNLTFTIPTHALNCDMLRNTTNTSVGATSTTGGLALTASPFHDVSNATSAYVLPTRNNTGDGQFAGALSAGTPTTGIVTGDLSASRTTGTGLLWLGSNGSQSLDFGITNANEFTLVGGGLVLPSGISGNFAGSGTETLGTNGGTGGLLTLNGATSGAAAIGVPAAAGSPATIELPSATGSSGYVLSTNGASPQVTSWIPVPVAGGYATQALSSTVGSSSSFGNITGTLSLTAPSTGGPFRLVTSYFVAVAVINPIDFRVTDGTNHWGYTSIYGAGTGGTDGGVSNTEESPVTYANGATVSVNVQDYGPSGSTLGGNTGVSVSPSYVKGWFVPSN